MAVAVKESSETDVSLLSFFAFAPHFVLERSPPQTPKTKLQNVIFTIIMAVIMVYGMIV